MERKLSEYRIAKDLDQFDSCLGFNFCRFICLGGANAFGHFGWCYVTFSP